MKNKELEITKNMNPHLLHSTDNIPKKVSVKNKKIRKIRKHLEKNLSFDMTPNNLMSAVSTDTDLISALETKDWQKAVVIKKRAGKYFLVVPTQRLKNDSLYYEYLSTEIVANLSSEIDCNSKQEVFSVLTTIAIGTSLELVIYYDEELGIYEIWDGANKTEIMLAWYENKPIRLFDEKKKKLGRFYGESSKLRCKAFEENAWDVGEIESLLRSKKQAVWTKTELTVLANDDNESNKVGQTSLKNFLEDINNNFEKAIVQVKQWTTQKLTKRQRIVEYLVRTHSTQPKPAMKVRPIIGDLLGEGLSEDLIKLSAGIVGLAHTTGLPFNRVRTEQADGKTEAENAVRDFLIMASFLLIVNHIDYMNKDFLYCLHDPNKQGVVDSDSSLERVLREFEVARENYLETHSITDFRELIKKIIGRLNFLLLPENIKSIVERNNSKYSPDASKEGKRALGWFNNLKKQDYGTIIDIIENVVYAPNGLEQQFLKMQHKHLTTNNDFFTWVKKNFAHLRGHSTLGHYFKKWYDITTDEKFESCWGALVQRGTGGDNCNVGGYTASATKQLYNEYKRQAIIKEIKRGAGMVRDKFERVRGFEYKYRLDATGENYVPNNVDSFAEENDSGHTGAVNKGRGQHAQDNIKNPQSEEPLSENRNHKHKTKDKDFVRRYVKRINKIRVDFKVALETMPDNSNKYSDALQFEIELFKDFLKESGFGFTWVDIQKQEMWDKVVGDLETDKSEYLSGKFFYVKKVSYPVEDFTSVGEYFRDKWDTRVEKIISHSD